MVFPKLRLPVGRPGRKSECHQTIAFEVRKSRKQRNEVLRKGLVFFKHGRMEGCCGLNLRYHFQSVPGLHFSELDPGSIEKVSGQA